MEFGVWGLGQIRRDGFSGISREVIELLIVVIFYDRMFIE